jgi:hypothetical protein
MQVIHYIIKYKSGDTNANLEINYDEPLTELEYARLKKKLESAHGRDVVICNVMTFPK